MAEWKSGPPQEDGIFWFDLGIFEDKDTFLIVDRKNGIAYANGHYGSGPIEHFWSPKVKTAKHMPVKPVHINGEWNNKWNNEPYAWVCSPEGFYGFALLRHDFHGPSGHVIYLNHPHSRATYGEWLKHDHGWKFQPVSKPQKGRNK